MRWHSGALVRPSQVPELVRSEVLRDVMRVVAASAEATSGLPLPMLEQREALAHAVLQHRVAKMSFDMPVEAIIGPTRATIRVQLPRLVKPSVIHIDLHSAGVSIEGSEARVSLPELREPLVVPHPLEPRLRRSLEVVQRVLDCLEIEDRSLLDALRAAREPKG